MDWSTAPQPPPEPEDSLIVCRIELTTEQRKAVKEETGRDLHFVPVSDESGRIARTMGSRSQETVLLFALAYAQRLNQRDALQQEYLEELAKWQDEQTKESTVDAVEAAADEDIEAAQIDIAEFHAEEAKAFEAARAEAVEVWDPKGKKRKKEGR